MHREGERERKRETRTHRERHTHTWYIYILQAGCADCLKGAEGDAPLDVKELFTLHMATLHRSKEYVPSIYATALLYNDILQLSLSFTCSLPNSYFESILDATFTWHIPLSSADPKLFV